MGAGTYSLTVDVSVTGSHSNFPALVVPSDHGITLTQAEADSLRFYTSSSPLSGEIPREIVGADEIWVKVPTLTGSTVIYMDWDDSDGSRNSDYAITDPYGAENVWPSAYEGVWHLNQDPSGTVLDSTSNSRDLTSGGTMTSGDVVSGPFGTNAIDFDGTDDYLYSSSQGLNITGDLTLEFWLYADTWSALDGVINFQGLNDNTEDDNVIYSLRGYTVGGNGIFNWHEYGSGTNQSTIFDAGLSTATWYHLHYVRDGTAKSWALYNGTSSVSVTVGQSTTYSTAPTGGTAGQFHLAKEREPPAGSPSFLNGRLAFVSVRSATTDANWISAAHSNQNDNAAFWAAASISGGVTFLPKSIMF